MGIYTSSHIAAKRIKEQLNTPSEPNEVYYEYETDKEDRLSIGMWIYLIIMSVIFMTIAGLSLYETLNS